LMGISGRTAQQWRDDGLIQFSQIGNKLYYRMSDINRFLDNNLKTSV
jgi:predicted site-specific integrase-resolvase